MVHWQTVTPKKLITWHELLWHIISCKYWYNTFFRKSLLQNHYWKQFFWHIRQTQYCKNLGYIKTCNMTQRIILCFLYLPLHTSSLCSSWHSGKIYWIKPSVSMLALTPSSLLVWRPVHCVTTSFWGMNRIYTVTITVTFVWYHFRKSVGLDCPWFLSLHLLGLLCQKSLIKKLSVAGIGRTYIWQLPFSKVKYTVRLVVTIWK